MNKLGNLKKIVLVSLVALILGISSSVYATDQVVILDDSSTNDTVNVISDQYGDGASNNIDDINIVENDTNEVEIDNEIPEEIPDTGKEDTLLISVIVVMAISAVYTHIKLKKYDF